MKLYSTQYNGAKNKLLRDKALKTGRLLKVTREKIGRTLKCCEVDDVKVFWSLTFDADDEKVENFIKETQ